MYIDIVREICAHNNISIKERARNCAIRIYAVCWNWNGVVVCSARIIMIMKSWDLGNGPTVYGRILYGMASACRHGKPCPQTPPSARGLDMSKLVESFQADLPTRVFRVTNGFNEAMYLAANEPSLGMYRLQEHIQANVPKVVQQKQTLQNVCSLKLS